MSISGDAHTPPWRDDSSDRGPFLHGQSPYIDDIILMPMVDALIAIAPEGPGLVAEAPNVARHRAEFQKRPSYAATLPEMFAKAA